MKQEEVNCLVVDDEPLAIGLLEKHIAQFSRLKLIESCWNAVQAFEVLQREKIDLIFLDIQMPGMTGVEFIKSLKNPPSIIFTTAYREYAVESYELDVVDYLLKPITMDRFMKAINKYLSNRGTETKVFSSPSESQDEDALFVNSNKKYIKVLFQEVLYIESLKDYVQIHSISGKVSTKDKISVFEHKLPDYFIRVHRSFIVNTRQITAFTAHDIEIGELEIPIGISYKSEVMNLLARIKN